MLKKDRMMKRLLFGIFCFLFVNSALANNGICSFTTRLYNYLLSYQCIAQQAPDKPLAARLRYLSVNEAYIHSICNATTNADYCKTNPVFSLRMEAEGLANSLTEKETREICYMLNETKGMVLFYLKPFLDKNCH
ncbi:hypothetical protein CbuD7D7780_00330 [Coxiella burnetii]|uniref:Hypothetical exported protein n=1 Tax=Coxiella burnetii (strain Dugway 5J108-111) TaxID=434922 RepID=A9KF15_COXBN|nr:hypothetical protein [Coxiella burnetii]ABS78076.2 hypothetical exported protein [Coxiella burnetii Dugway 5J108-111]OYK81134.1 hypothetical protein CbuD7E6568_00330 [Coxiella burnetii]OYK83225.1 hypothetical protein CbuD7D7780_00330 [Coxiella burnetii]